MRRKLFVAAVLLLVFAGAYIGKNAIHKQKTDVLSDSAAGRPRAAGALPYERIVSMAPSITEILFELGLGDNVVGVTDYCDYPPEVLDKEKIGGYYDPNYEAVYLLNPDLVIMLTEHEEPKTYFSQLGLNVLVVDHSTISGILKSIMAVGKTNEVLSKAESLVRDLRERMEQIRIKTQDLERPRVMVSVGRNMGSGSLKDVYISGKDNFYDEMITLSGGINSYEGKVAFPVVSGEGIIRINPEVIIDMIPDIELKSWNRTMILKEWETVSQVDAVKNGRVYIFGEDYVVVPGPRFILILEKMAKVLHPDVDWE
jgi:iron complex transport system substrate-binding protein